MNDHINTNLVAFYDRVFWLMLHRDTFNPDRAYLTLVYVLENPQMLLIWDRKYNRRTTIKYGKLRWLCGKEKRNRKTNTLLNWEFFKLVASAVAKCLDGEASGLNYVQVLLRTSEYSLRGLS